MGGMKERMMDMDELIVEAIERGAQSEADVIAYVNTFMVADEDYIAEQMELMFGPMDSGLQVALDSAAYVC